METFISRQAFLIILAFALGALIGLFYDLIRPFRRRCGIFGRTLTDFIFCLISAFTLFTFSMGAGNGRLGQWELAFALMGFLNYLYTVSDRVFSFFDGKLGALISQSGKIKDQAEKYKRSGKKFFKKMLKCYIIKDRS